MSKTNLEHVNNTRRSSHKLKSRLSVALMGIVLCAVAGTSFAQGDELPFGNLLPIQSAIQSSTGFNRPARLAFDGNTDGVFRGGSVTHTAIGGNFQPSWTGDIGGVTDITNVRVWRRTDVSQLNNYYVSVSELPFKSQSLDVTLADPNVTSIFRAAPSTTQDFDTFPVFTRGRFVRIQMQGDDQPLTLAEVQVFGNDSVALPQLISPVAIAQSSTAFGAPADRAADRNLDGVFARGSVTHTRNTLQPSWTADLGSVADLSEIRLWNRTDCCSDRLTNLYVLVSDEPFSSGSLDEQLADSDVESFFIPEVTVGSGDEAIVSDSISLDTTGRFIRVQLEGTNPLSLAEVEIFGSSDSPTIEEDITLAGELFVSVERLNVGFNAAGLPVFGHWVLDFEDEDTVLWSFTDVLAVGTYPPIDDSDSVMFADFSASLGAQIEYEFDGVNLIWDSREYLRTSSSIDSQESLFTFLDNARYESVEEFPMGQGPDGQTVLGKNVLEFDGDEFVLGTGDVLTVGTLEFDGDAGFRLTRAGGGSDLPGFVLDDGSLIVNFVVYTRVDG